MFLYCHPTTLDIKLKQYINLFWQSSGVYKWKQYKCHVYAELHNENGSMSNIIKLKVLYVLGLNIQKCVHDVIELLYTSIYTHFINFNNSIIYKTQLLRWWSQWSVVFVFVGRVYATVNFSVDCVFIHNCYDVDGYGVTSCSSNLLSVLYVFMK